MQPERYARDAGSRQVPPRKRSLPGLASSVASAAILHHHGPFCTRLAANDPSALVCASQVSFNFQAVDFAAETVPDDPAACRITQHLSALLRVPNPADRPSRRYFGNPRETSTLQCVGRTRYAGFSLTL